MSATEYTLIFGLGPKNDGTPNTDVELAVALAAIEDASLKYCGGFTIHRGKGGWYDPAGYNQRRSRHPHGIRQLREHRGDCRHR